MIILSKDRIKKKKENSRRKIKPIVLCTTNYEYVSKVKTFTFLWMAETKTENRRLKDSSSQPPPAQLVCKGHITACPQHLNKVKNMLKSQNTGLKCSRV